MWRPRDRERFIGGYDPEREMPDPSRERGDRWQSSAYRHNARDSRFAYRWNPDRIEDRSPDRDPDRDRFGRWLGDARDFDRDRGFRGGYGFDSDAGRDYDPDWDRERFARDRWDRGYADEHDRGYSRPYDEYDRDRWRR